ncbi:MAG: hypothetical protein ABIP79_15055 [Chitinophagaceae bacterium]
MNDAKIRLSQKEMELIRNADLILTKNAILKKVDHFFSDLQIKQKISLDQHYTKLPVELIQSSPKISKGEYYNGLPYRMLDFPKIFNHSEIFAIRTMFWWGHFFSFTIHLAGKYKTLYEKKITTAYSLLKENDFYYCINKEQWEHHFEEANYKPIETLTEKEFEKIVKSSTFCKIAYKFPLQEFDIVEKALLINFKKIIEMLAD